MIFYYLQTEAFVAWHLKITVYFAIPFPDSAHPINMNVHSR